MTWDRDLVAAAQAALDASPRGNSHTVAAAVRDSQGRIHTGLNLYHFAGGACAEVVALANTAGCEARSIVAYGDNSRGVIPPCGSCRQMMLDLHPGIAVLLPQGATAAIEELLPVAYRWQPDS